MKLFTKCSAEMDIFGSLDYVRKLMGSGIFESVAMLVFGKTDPKEGGGICREEEAIFCRADSGGDEAG